MNLPSFGKRLVQRYGHLIVISSDNTITGISEDFGKLIGESDVPGLLGTSFSDLATSYFGYDAQKIRLTVDKVRFARSPRQLIMQVINDENYYLCIYLYKSNVHLEWERQKRKSISAHEMNEIGFLFERNPSDIWNSLCRAIQTMLHYDGVFVFNTSESSTGHVIAEYTKDNQLLFLGKRFSPAYMPAEIIQYYEVRSYQFCPNIFAPFQLFYTLDNNINLDPCPYLPLPEQHDLYLKKLGVISIIAFPIIVNGNFWGLVVAHSKKEKDIDLQKRKLCSFIVQNAIVKHEALMKQNLLQLHGQMKDAELDLKGKLLFARTVNCALAQSMTTLCDIPKADGLALFYKGDLFTHRLCPSQQHLRQIVEFIRTQPKSPLFKDNNFGLKHSHLFQGELPFAGLMVLEVGQCKDHYILWFRKETVQMVTQICPVQENIIQPNGRVRKVVLYETWEENFLHTALPWDDDDLSFVRNLDRLINDAIITKSREYEKYNEELISLNNELEMLTYTMSHDLKNPLSIVKIGVQFLEANLHLPQDKQKKWHKSILESVAHIEGMIDQLLHLSSANQYPYTKDPIPMSYTIRTLCEDAKILYNSPKCELILDKLLPVWGEKSILYQIFLNIIGNAVKYSAKNTTPRIEITSRHNKDQLIYTIKDNGIGIPPDQFEGIFELFQRASNSDSFKGSGLGLCLVKRIMTKIDGEIKISSEMGKGTSVDLIFPSIGDFPPSMEELV